MIEIMKEFDKENEEGKALNRFFNLLIRYNRRMPINEELRE